MVEVKQQFDGTAAPPNFDSLAANDGRKGGQPLLAVKQESRALVGIDFLRNRHVLQ
jgi:hypothetical protein